MGYIGAALGLGIGELYTGSWVAAGFPFGGSAWENERGDWTYIRAGFNAFRRR